MESGPEPAGCATIRRIGFSGQACARTSGWKPVRAAAVAARVVHQRTGCEQARLREQRAAAGGVAFGQVAAFEARQDVLPRRVLHHATAFGQQPGITRARLDRVALADHRAYALDAAGELA